MTQPPSQLFIRQAQRKDAAAIAKIYNHYIANTVISFEEKAVTEPQMAERMDQVSQAAMPWLIAEQDGEVIGYCYAKPWHERAAYRRSAEIAIYLAPTATSQGLGTRLYEKVIADLQAQGMHTVIGGIALPNAASVALHEKLGFTKAAHYREVGHKFDQWIDVGYWQLMLGDEPY